MDYDENDDNVLYSSVVIGPGIGGRLFSTPGSASTASPDLVEFLAAGGGDSDYESGASTPPAYDDYSKYMGGEDPLIGEDSLANDDEYDTDGEEETVAAEQLDEQEKLEALEERVEEKIKEDVDRKLEGEPAAVEEEQVPSSIPTTPDITGLIPPTTSTEMAGGDEPATCGGECISAGIVSDDKVGGEHISAGQISDDKVGGEHISAGQIPDDKVGGEHISAGQISDDKVGGECISSVQISDDKVGGECISTGQIPDEKMGGKCSPTGGADCVPTENVDDGDDCIAAGLISVDNGGAEDDDTADDTAGMLGGIEDDE